jgi:hypothetical protein
MRDCQLNLVAERRLVADPVAGYRHIGGGRAEMMPNGRTTGRCLIPRPIWLDRWIAGITKRAASAGRHRRAQVEDRSSR